MRSILKTLVYTLVALCLCLEAFAQGNVESDNLVRNRLKRIALGQTSEVRSELPDLLSEFPNDPGVRLLHAVLVEDASLALPMFEKIVQEYPQSEWADDAQWRVVQIYVLRGDSARAWQELQEYRKQYPDSEFLLFASELVKNAVGSLPPSRKVAVYESKPVAEKPAVAQETRQTPKKTESAKSTEKATEKAAATKSATDKPAEKAAEKTTTAKPATEKAAEKATTAKPATEKAAEKVSEKAAHESVPKESKESAPKEKDGADSYALQVGLYSSRQGAESEVEKFRSARMRTEIIEKTVESEKKYAVIIGSYSTREGAEKAKETVEKYCGCTPFIIER